MTQQYGSTYAATIPALTDTANITQAFKDYHDSVTTFLNSKANLSGAVFTGAVTFGTGGSITLPTGSVTSGTIADGAIVDVDINSGAAIAYSKLNLAGQIVNADISSSAAIAISKISGLDTALSGKAPLANPTFSGTVDLSGTTLTLADNAITQAKVSGLVSALAAKAPLASPALTGTATAVNLTVSGTLTATLTGNASTATTATNATNGANYGSGFSKITVSQTQPGTANTGDVWISW